MDIYNTITFQNKIDQIWVFFSNLQHNIILSEQCFKSRWSEFVSNPTTCVNLNNNIPWCLSTLYFFRN